MTAKRVHVESFMVRHAGPMATVRGCRFCNFLVRIPRGQGGFAAGNRANGEMLAHFKEAHPEIYAALRAGVPLPSWRIGVDRCLWARQFYQVVAMAGRATFPLDCENTYRDRAEAEQAAAAFREAAQATADT